MNRQVIIVISAEERDGANAAAKDQFDPEGGERTFTSGLSADGSAPATHYWCCARFRDEAMAKLGPVAQTFASARVFVEREPGEVLAECGLKPVTVTDP